MIWAEPSTQVPGFARTNGLGSGKRREGLKYEAAVMAYLDGEFGEFFVPGPWFRFESNGGDRVRWCQPDGLIFDIVEKVIYVVEVKLKHTTDAWWQLRHLYLPVLAKIFPPEVWEYRPCEIVRWYEKDLPFPEPVTLVQSPLALRSGQFGVHIWAP